MLGFEEDEPFWADWTPREPGALEVADELSPTTFFDAWRVDDPRFVEPLWDTLFHMLAMLQMSDGMVEAAPGLQFLQTQLDPQWNDLEVEITFLSQSDGQAEGVVVRLANSDGAGMWIEAYRLARESNSPVSWRILAEPAVVESDAVIVGWSLDDGEWRGQIQKYGDDQGVALHGGAWPEVIAILEEVLWDEISGRSYLEPDFEVAVDDSDLGPGWPASLGETVRQREISDYVGDTMFVPGF